MENWLSGMMSGLGNIFGSLISGAYGIKATRETNAANVLMNSQTNAANLQIAQETNDTNYQIAKENNETQIELAEKAYQRSTASNQIAEYIKAGYSPEQAKILASGSQASYTAPSLQQSTMIPGAPQQPGHVEQADYSYLNGVGQGAGQAMGSALTATIGSLTDPTGGFLGASLSMDLQNLLAEYGDQMPQFANVNDLLAWARDVSSQGPVRSMTEDELSKQQDLFDQKGVSLSYSLGNPLWDVADRILNDKILQQGYKSIPARNSLNTYLQRCVTEHSNLTSAQIRQQQVLKGLNDLNLQNMEIEQEKINLAKAYYTQRGDLEVARVMNEHSISKMNNEMAQYNNQIALFEDPTYKANWLRQRLIDSETAIQISAAQKILAEQEYSIIEDSPGLTYTVSLARFLVDNGFFTATGAITDSIAKFIPNLGKLLPSQGSQTITRDLGNGTKISEVRPL